jgi:acyl-CoA thioester hydrolase
MKKLSAEIKIKVRFNDADPLGIVWHGNYVTYFEDARDAFGEKYDFTYLNVYEQGFSMPLVNLNIDYKLSVQYGDEVLVKIYYEPSMAAKVIFKYELFRLSDQKLCAKGTTTQVFMDKSGELHITNPSFYESWKKKQEV